jgi:hypothetical protein
MLDFFYFSKTQLDFVCLVHLKHEAVYDYLNEASCITDELCSQPTMQNNIYMIMTPKCFNTFVPSSGNSKVVVRLLRSFYIIKISLKIIKLKYLCGC